MNPSTIDVEATPHKTAQPTAVGPQYGNENDGKCLEEICEANTTPVSDTMAAMEGAIPRVSTILRDTLARLAKKEEPEQQQPTKKYSLTEVVKTYGVT